MTNEIGVADAAKRAGVTYRQLDYWITQGLVASSGSLGSGHVRTMSLDDIPKVRTLGRVSRAFRRNSKATAVPLPLLEAAAKWWPAGRVDLGEGVVLTWEVDREQH